jgi:hypothetical protein
MRKIALIAVVAFAAACGSSSSSTPTGYFRVGNLSFGSPEIDFCVATSGSATFTGPVMRAAGSVTTGSALPYEFVSKYFAYGAGSYTVRVVPYAANSCTTAVPGIADVSVTVADGGYYTIAAAGIIGQSAPVNAQLKVFTDVSTPDATKVTIRFVNALPSATIFDIGTGLPTAFTPIFSHLAFLGLATPSVVVNSLGYAVVSPSGFAPPVILTTCVNGVPPTAQTCPSSVTLTPSQAAGIQAGTVASAFLVPTLTAGELLLCGDSAGIVPSTNWSACVVGN